jgi:arylsulfatase
LVRWFSPEDYEAPTTPDEFYAKSDVSLHDLVEDPGEMENIGHPNHPAYDPQLVERMLKKLNALIEREVGEDRCPFDLDLFGTREVKYGQRTRGARTGTAPASSPTRMQREKEKEPAKK